MLCAKCNKEWSDKVYPHHVERCQGKPKPVKKAETPKAKPKAKAKK